MSNYTLNLISATDIPLVECGLTLHQPTIKEISMLGEINFWSSAQILTIKASSVEGGENYSNFQIFITMMHDPKFKEKATKVLELLSLILPLNSKVSLLPRALLINLNQDNIIIDENNFTYFQDAIREMWCLSGKQSNEFNPGSAAAAEIARKLERGRQRVAAQKSSSEGNSSVFSQYLSILSIGLHIHINELTNLTVYQLYDLIERYTLKTHWDLDIKQRLAGGKPDSEAENWMKVIH